MAPPGLEMTHHRGHRGPQRDRFAEEYDGFVTIPSAIRSLDSLTSPFVPGSNTLPRQPL
jgi:hypothetical protein